MSNTLQEEQVEVVVVHMNLVKTQQTEPITLAVVVAVAVHQELDQIKLVEMVVQEL
jgi:hypothetical protein